MRFRLVSPIVAFLLAGILSLSAAEPIKLPDLPAQQTPWKPSGDIPANILSAVEKLFAQGFPDPRGCEYRSVKVETSSVWEGKGHVLETHGWVIPGPSDGKPKYVLCWNGVIYRAVEIGKTEDLSADAASLPVMNPRRFDAGIGEMNSVAAASSPSARVLLLLRCGQTVDALKTWNPDAPRRTGLKQNEEAQDYDPYYEMAGDWAWSLFDHALSAHMRGDEATALAAVEKLVEIQPKIEAEAEQRGYRHPTAYNPGRPDTKLPYLEFLHQVPEFTADLKRRVAQPDRVSVVEKGLKTMTNQVERIRALINDLDLVNARQWSQPGSVSLGGDPIVSALIAEGEPAVEPLINCLETDQRLTRSVSFHRDFFRRRYIHAVAEAARVALQQILHAEFNGGPMEIRAYWATNRTVKLEERWYNELRDDKAEGRWVEAAQNITQPINVTTFRGSMFGQVDDLQTNGPVPMRGESLRKKTNPSVSELIAKRTMELAEKQNPYDQFILQRACGLGLALADWDTNAAVPIAKKLMDACIVSMDDPKEQDSWPKQCLGEIIAKLTIARVNGSDKQALKDYADWVVTMSPKRLETYIEKSLLPLVRYATNPLIKAVSLRMFDSPESAWNSLPWKQAGLFDPIESDLVKVVGFRRLLARELENKATVGSWQWHQPEMLGFQIGQYKGGNLVGIKWPAAEVPADGVRSEMRQCDWVAVTLSQKKEIPFFNPFAPVGKRDEAIKKAIELLKESQ